MNATTTKTKFVVDYDDDDDDGNIDHENEQLKTKTTRAVDIHHDDEMGKGEILNHSGTDFQIGRIPRPRVTGNCSHHTAVVDPQDLLRPIRHPPSLVVAVVHLHLLDRYQVPQVRVRVPRQRSRSAHVVRR